MSNTTPAPQSVQQVDPRTLLVDVNVRTDARVDAPLVDSIRDLGVLQPIVGVCTADGTVRVRYGHRRTLAAVEAGLATVPVLVVGDEATTDAGQVDRLVGQWTENEHRVGLRVTEKAAATAQLAAFGLSPAQIARRTRTARADVTAALAVAGSPAAGPLIDAHDLDLSQAVVVAEFADDPAAVDALVRAVGTGQFPHVAQRLRDDRADAKDRADTTDQLTAVGLRVVDRPSWGDRAARLESLTDEDGQALTEQAHDRCPGRAVYVEGTWVTVADTITAGSAQDWACECGNTAAQDGFLPLAEDGTTALETTDDGPWDGVTHVCPCRCAGSSWQPCSRGRPRPRAPGSFSPVCWPGTRASSPRSVGTRSPPPSSERTPAAGRSSTGAAPGSPPRSAPRPRPARSCSRSRWCSPAVRTRSPRTRGATSTPPAPPTSASSQRTATRSATSSAAPPARTRSSRSSPPPESPTRLPHRHHPPGRRGRPAGQ